MVKSDFTQSIRTSLAINIRTSFFYSDLVKQYSLSFFHELIMTFMQFSYVFGRNSVRVTGIKSIKYIVLHIVTFLYTHLDIIIF